MTKTIPTREELVGYSHAVAGHDGILSDTSGELFIKPCTSTEIAFYETSLALYPEFVQLMPTYLGTLALDKKDSTVTAVSDTGTTILANNDEQNIEHMEQGVTVPPSDETTCEEQAHQTGSVNILRPKKTSLNIHGHKISTNKAVVLENASYGFRKPNILDIKLGVRLWADDAAEHKRIRFDKITAESTHKDLGFRIAGMRVWQGLDAKGTDVDEEGYKIYDKNYGRYSVNQSNIHEAFRNFILRGKAGVCDELGKQVTQAFLTDVTRIQSALESHENRMFSSSLLFVYEGDGEALKEALRESSCPPKCRDNSGDEEDSRPKIYTVKLIDFAHAEWTPGLGPDENTLIGVRSVARILKDLIMK